MEVTIANLQDIDRIWEIISANAQWLLNYKGLSHWSSYYTKDLIVEVCKTKTVFVLKNEHGVVGLIAISDHMPDYYTEPSKEALTKLIPPVLFLSMLAVDPAYHRHGFANILLDFIEKYAKDNKYKTVCLDCRAEDTSLVAWYLRKQFGIHNTFVEGEDETYLMMQKMI